MRVLFLLLVFVASTASAVVETYEFEDEQLRHRYTTFVAELRCPKCQNQNLAGSNSPIAEDLRRELYRLLEEGKSDQQIVDYMVDRYGDFILYRPRFNPETAVLWLAPIIFLVLGLMIAVAAFIRQRRSAADDDEQQLNASEQKQLQDLLELSNGKDKTNA